MVIGYSRPIIHLDRCPFVSQPVDGQCARFAVPAADAVVAAAVAVAASGIEREPDSCGSVFTLCWRETGRFVVVVGVVVLKISRFYDFDNDWGLLLLFGGIPNFTLNRCSGLSSCFGFSH